jgi:LPS-assembly lipoprotein
MQRRVLLAIGLAAMAGCGFKPVYGPGGSGAGLQGAILADAPDTREGFDFVAHFEERLGRSDTPRYALRYEIRTREEGVGITPAAETTRFNLFGAVTYRVIDLETDTAVTDGFAETFTGYSTTRFTVSTDTVERDARQRLMKILADQVVTELIATAPDWRRDRTR